jgi:elongation factor Ts
MPEITAKTVMDLRDATGLPMMKCKQALAANNGDQAAAIDWLRKQGVATAGKFSGRDTPNGSIGMAFAGGKGALVLLGCQTDFVANTEEFKAVTAALAKLAVEQGIGTVDALNAATLDGRVVTDVITGMIQKIGENIKVADVKTVTGAVVTGYNHGGKIAALVAGEGSDAEALRKIAMHVASSDPAPVSVDRGSVDPELVKKEEEILLATPDVQAKPEAMRPKIVQGKLGRFFKENCLLEQEMLLDSDKGESVEAYGKRKGVKPTAFVRIKL